MTKETLLYISKEVNISYNQVKNTLLLLQDGATIPFISRYRKEVTGQLNEVEIENIFNKYTELEKLQKRKENIIAAIKKQNKMTDLLAEKISLCMNSNELEDIYIPYKTKRVTKAEKARIKGLEPLAKILMAQNNINVENAAYSFCNKEVKNTIEAIQGAQYIIAEWLSENKRIRNEVRYQFKRNAILTSKVIKGKEEEAKEKFKDYFDFSEPLKKCSSHRILALLRGEKEGYLRINISPDDIECLERLNNIILKNNSSCTSIIKAAIKDSYSRLVKPSIKTEFINSSKEKADNEAINVFIKNLKQLLLSPPLGQKRILALDPGFRTGCKVVCLDEQGKLLHNETIFPHPPHNKVKSSMSKISHLVESYNIEAISIGNGTASRETESFIKRIQFDRKIEIYIVSESGASIYSASSVAREEFPEYDVTVRGTVSIGRRLADPLAELVKIEPKSLGIGQYQHDVNQTKLSAALDSTVISCVNKVGVNLNTASKYLLMYISGLSKQTATNIISYREKNGAFKNRKELLKVPQIGQKVYEQAVGFLRIKGGDNILDATAVHPESYHIVTKIAKDLNIQTSKLICNNEILDKIIPEKYITQTVGLPTIKDIIEELKKPGRDPRKEISVFKFSDNIKSIDDLKVGMIIPGIITNITNFGAFVDLGIKINGLIHISQITDKYISSPSDFLFLNQQIKTKVIDIDKERNRIQLSLKQVNK